MAAINRKEVRKLIHLRIRKKMHGTPARPRLAVHFSNQHVRAQVIDDDAGTTIAAVASLEKEIGGGSNVATASRLGAVLAERAQAKGITTVVFDRGGFTYHGKVKAFADAAREKGLKF